MSYKKIIIEQSDDEEQNNSDYIPNRNEAFIIGLTESWKSANRIMPFLLVIVLMIMLFIC